MTEDPGGLFLSPGEIERLTGYIRKAEQRRELAAMGIGFKVNRLGQPIVVRDSLYQDFGCTNRRPCMPDLEALEALDGSKT